MKEKELEEAVSNLVDQMNKLGNLMYDRMEFLKEQVKEQKDIIFKMDAVIQEQDKRIRELEKQVNQGKGKILLLNQ